MDSSKTLGEAEAEGLGGAAETRGGAKEGAPGEVLGTGAVQPDKKHSRNTEAESFTPPHYPSMDTASRSPYNRPHEPA
jgi:hypothetical protein